MTKTSSARPDPAQLHRICDHERKTIAEAQPVRARYAGWVPSKIDIKRGKNGPIRLRGPNTSGFSLPLLTKTLVQIKGAALRSRRAAVPPSENILNDFRQWWKITNAAIHFTEFRVLWQRWKVYNESRNTHNSVYHLNCGSLSCGFGRDERKWITSQRYMISHIQTVAN